MRKITALILATIMVALCFSVATVASAEDTNLLAGMSYTVGGDATAKDAGTAGADTDPGTLLTDGVVRTPEEMNSTGGPVSGKTLEYQGTYKTVSFTFEFDEAVSIATLVADGARGWDVAANASGEAAPNRHCNFSNIEVSTDGLNFTAVDFTVAKEVIAGSAQYGTAAPADQFWTITATLATVANDVAALRVTFDTTRDDGSNAYIVQLDELEAYGTASAPVESSEAPVESSEAPVESSEVEDTTVEDTTVEDTTVEDTTVEDTTVEDTTEEVVVADITYTITFTVEEDGTIAMTITLPEGIASGNIVFNFGADLALVEGTLTNALPGAVNTEYEGGIMLNFAGMSAYPAGTTFATAKLTLAEGATLDASDIEIVAYELSSTSEIVSTQENGTCEIIVPVVEEETTEETTSEDTTAEDTTAEDTTVEDTTVEETSEESEGDAPATGDSGIAVFAVLALVSAAAVVVLKKRA